MPRINASQSDSEVDMDINDIESPDCPVQAGEPESEPEPEVVVVNEVDTEALCAEIANQVSNREKAKEVKDASVAGTSAGMKPPPARRGTKGRKPQIRAEIPLKISRILELHELPTRQYLDRTVSTIIMRGLQAVSMERPVDPIGYMAEYLRIHKMEYEKPPPQRQ